MYNHIVLLCLCVSLSGVLCEHLNKQEGEQCEWEGLSGKCVQETACLTTLDDDSPKHPICTKTWEEKVICCTDCQLVNNTKNAILTPSGLFWKNGQKARDSCLQYLQDLPYKCKGDDFVAGIMRELDEENKCYGYSEWESSSDDSESRAEYPHQALLGYGEELASVKWERRGSIISDKYILTSAIYPPRFESRAITFVAVGVNKLSDGPNTWQTHTVKRYIPHPDISLSNFYNDIALVEIKDTITFNKNVLPVCLHVEAADDETAITTISRGDTLQGINVNKFSEMECKNAFFNVLLSRTPLHPGINNETQMCYGKSSDSPCEGRPGEPLLISTQFSSCIHTVIGVTSFETVCGLGNLPNIYIYTRVAHYIPWIESVLWPKIRI